MSLLDNVNSPEDLKSLTVDQLQTLCQEIRQYMIECCAKNPGHLGSSLGTVELAVALHYVYNTPKDKLVWDVGHQAYAHKIITGRRELFKTNRKYQGISGFPKISESKYDAFGAGHSSTSISAALGMAVAAQLNHSGEKVIAIIGDGALTGGLAFEGLNNAGSLKSDILVIVNDNEISIDHGSGGMHEYLVKISTSPTYNKVKDKVWNSFGPSKFREFIQRFHSSTKAAIINTGSIFESLGFRYFGIIDGHNIEELTTTLSNLKEISGPKLLHIKTVKGKGYKPAEENQIVWHAPGTFDPTTGERIVKSEKVAKYQDVFGKTLLELAKENEKIVAITPAMATGCGMDLMAKEIPQRTYDVGIAEQHAVTFSAGLAAAGMLPICNIYSSFMQRAYDNIIHDVALQKLKVIFCLDRSGIVGEDGATHHGVFDMSSLRPVPNLTIASPYDERELRNLLYSATLPEYGTIIIRYPRGKGNGAKWENEPFEKVPHGKGRLIREGKDMAILSIGPIGKVAEKVTELAKEREISIAHFDVRFLKPLDQAGLEEIFEKFDKIITIEDGAKAGGLYGAINEFAAERKKVCKILGIGIPDKFIEQGTVSELYDECEMSAEKVFDKILQFF
ncbi:MAG: 1-deoxy-D-xylulose-5-phosphate synthase [Bacteroidales bacterium]|nr:1-deoxy-D-xylulose-5-phosphate synthase [Bacteroidales bacterium]